MQNSVILKQQLMFVSQIKKLEVILETFLMLFPIIFHLLQIVQYIDLIQGI